jgi:hypothetical protein
MEAARALHIREARRAPGGAQSGEPAKVLVEQDLIVIEHLAIQDATLADVIQRRSQVDIAAQDTVADALEIGARVLDREATAAEVDYVRRELERASSEIETSFAEQARKLGDDLEQRLEEFLGEDSGVMTRALDSHADELTELLSTNFGEERSTAVQHRIRELTAKLLDDSRQDLLKQFSAEDGHNPLSDFKGSMVREMRSHREVYESMREQVAQLRADVQRLHLEREAQLDLDAERERGTSKGRDFERQVFDVIERIALDRGDVALHVGDERTAAGGKRGDIVVEIDAAAGPAKGRVVFDAKDERLSKNSAWKTLNESLTQRDANFAVLVTASEQKVPAGREQLHEYEGNKMIVALDKDDLDERALKLAYGAARLRCLLASEKGLDMDAAGVRDAAQEAMSALKDAQKIRSALTGATKNVEGARSALDGMLARAEAALDRIEDLITTG